MLHRLFRGGARRSLPSRERMSVVVVAYNMARELPRTIETLAASMQLGMSEDDYEIVVVDNGSTRPFDRGQIESIAGNISVLDVPSPNASPAKAVNFGVARSRFPIIGILIDGARMASPGLLFQARRALSIGPDVVVGTFGFHIGSKVQMEAVHDGYNQQAEDKILEECNWREDPYRLFSVSVLAGSSSRGWFYLPQETNAVFLRRTQFEALGGFDERFVLPGGGLVNHDFWIRACNAPSSQIVMLIGEATFHQFHGGAATNARQSPWAVFTEEYARVTGHAYAHKDRQYTLYGSFGAEARRHLFSSAL